jgi:hypothetical protein
MPYAIAGWLLFLFHLAALIAFAALALSSCAGRARWCSTGVELSASSYLPVSSCCEGHSPPTVRIPLSSSLAACLQRGVGASVGRKGCSRVVDCPPLLATAGWCRKQCARLAVLAELSPFRSDLCCASLAAARVSMQSILKFDGI